MVYRTLESVLYPDNFVALPSAELPKQSVRVMVTILDDDEATDHANGIDSEHRKWINTQIQAALDDPREDVPITPEFWEDWRKELEEKLAAVKP